MVVFLNLLVALICFAGVFAAYKLHKAWPLLVTGVVIVLYMNFQPSYMPKGEVKRSEIPVFEKSDAKVEDRILSAKDGEQYDKEREEKIKEGLPFVK